jgi:hypothetical protein
MLKNLFAYSHEMMASDNSDVLAAEHAKQDHEYLSGSKLISVLVAVTLAFFLVMLDTSIVATVRTSSSPRVECSLTGRIGHTSDHDRFSLPHRFGLVW